MTFFSFKMLAPCIAVAAAFFVAPTSAIHACDSEQGSLCPEAAGSELGACFKEFMKKEPGRASEISQSCLDFVAINDACSSEIEKHCSGNAYTDDTILCLSEWTRSDDLSAECAAKLPKKAAKEENAQVDKEKEEWRRKRKAARQASMDMMDKEKAKTDKKEKKQRRRGSKKNSEL